MPSTFTTTFTKRTILAVAERDQNPFGKFAGLVVTQPYFTCRSFEPPPCGIPLQLGARIKAENVLGSLSLRSRAGIQISGPARDRWQIREIVKEMGGEL